MKIGLVVVYHSGLSELEEMLGSVPENWSSVFLCDASPTGEASSLAEQRLDTTWVDCSRNGGYAWAVNRGVQSLLDTLGIELGVLIISNPDVVYSPEALEGLVESAREPGLFFPLQVDGEGKVLAQTVLGGLSRRGMLRNWLLPKSRSRELEAKGLRDLAEETKTAVRIPRHFAGSGACFAMNPTTWAALGGLEPRYFLFIEDISLSSKAHSLEIPIFLCGNVKVLHEGGFKSRGMTEFQLVEYLTSEQIAWSIIGRVPVKVLAIAQLLGITLRWIRFVIVGNVEKAAMYKKILRRLLRRRLLIPELFGRDGIRVSAAAAERITTGGA